MAEKTRTDIQNSIDIQIADNAPDGSITPAVIRGILTDINDSCSSKVTDTNLIGVREWDATRQYYMNEYTIYGGNWYKANTDPALTGIFDYADWDVIANKLYYTEKTIDSGNVLTSFDTPVEVLPAVSGKTIVVMNAFLKINYGSAAYDVNTTGQLITDTATLPQVEFLSGLNATVSRSYFARPKSAVPSASDTQLIQSKNLKFSTQTGNPTAGDSQIVICVYYMYI